MVATIVIVVTVRIITTPRTSNDRDNVGDDIGDVFVGLSDFKLGCTTVTVKYTQLPINMSHGSDMRKF